MSCLIKGIRVSPTTRTRTQSRPHWYSSIIVLLSIILLLLIDEASATQYQEKKQINGTQILWELHIPETSTTYTHLVKRPEYTLNGIVICHSNIEYDPPAPPPPPPASHTPPSPDKNYLGPGVFTPDRYPWDTEEDWQNRRGGPMHLPPANTDITHTFHEVEAIDSLDAFRLVEKWPNKFLKIYGHPDRVMIPHGKFGNNIDACSTTLGIANLLDIDAGFDVRWVDERIMAVYNTCAIHGFRGMFLSTKDKFSVVLIRTPGKWQHQIDNCVADWL